jgi:hypothetical protein
MHLNPSWYRELPEPACTIGHKMEQEGQVPHELRLSEEDGTLIESAAIAEHVVEYSSHQGVVHSLAIQVKASRRRENSPDDDHHLLPGSSVRFAPSSAHAALFAGNSHQYVRHDSEA